MKALVVNAPGHDLQGRMNLDDLVSRRIALREVNDRYAALEDASLNRA
jgi:Zn-dependent alcohol dehydrogenase